MKKTISIILAVMMLSALCATFVVSADGESFFVSVVDPDSSPAGTQGVMYTTANTNNGWWGQVSFKPVDGGEGWEVVATGNPEGTETGCGALEIPEGGFVWAIYPWSDDDAIRACFDFIVALEVGAQYTINGLDFANKTVAEDATFAPYVPAADDSEEPSEPAAEWKDLWVTHYNDNTAEGSGVVFTDAYEGAGWWYHVVFAPVEGSKAAYEIVAVSDGTPDGKGVAQAIPEGGFVYCLNYGNDYPALNGGDIDYATDGAKAMLEDVIANWKIGDKFVFDGIDFANKTVPTSTPDVEWYKDGEYVCTAKYKVYESAIDDVVDEESKEETTPDAGDASSMIVFAVIALVAIAGSAVVIKTRR